MNQSLEGKAQDYEAIGQMKKCLMRWLRR